MGKRSGSISAVSSNQATASVENSYATLDIVL